MKCTVITDQSREEEVVAYVHERDGFCEALERFCADDRRELTGYSDKGGVRLSPHEIIAVTVENGKTYAMTQKEKLLLKARLYQVETMLPDSFVKINQSAIANIKMIRSFDASISGTLGVTYENGEKDYVSRRCLRYVKEKLGV